MAGFSPTIASMSNAYALARMAHEDGAIVVFGGVNSTNLWQQMLANRRFVDAVVLYEGEGAMAEITRRWMLDKRGADLFSGIANVAYRNANGDVVGPEKIQVCDPNELPDIDYTLFDLPRYFQQTESRGFGRAVSYYAGKGCAKRSNARLRTEYGSDEYLRRAQAMNTCSFCGRNERRFSQRNLDSHLTANHSARLS